MLAVFDAVARGQAKWTEPLTITAADKVSGSGVLGTEFTEGDQLPLRDVMHLMIVLSDRRGRCASSSAVFRIFRIHLLNNGRTSRRCARGRPAASR
jgi:beta-lactamase family protein